ncbi:MAG: ATP-dependent 26S proteasome regulatory subunit, partial [Microbacterium sp.]|nr:ATP-dependent 26S proteasome regulatory subunit [Microbacterium sp.]
MSEVIWGVGGTLIRVTSVDPVSRTIYFRVRNGNDGSVSNLPDSDDVRPGDILIIGADGAWDVPPPDVWTEAYTVAVVRSVLDDGTVLVDNGATLKSVRNDREVNVEPNNTVEYSDIEGIARVVSETPIRSSQGDDVTIERVRADYLWDHKGL